VSASRTLAVPETSRANAVSMLKAKAKQAINSLITGISSKNDTPDEKHRLLISAGFFSSLILCALGNPLVRALR
jgi:hypothetical protein